MLTNTCENCRFWVPSPSVRGEGDCRSHAPHPKLYWAKTGESDWCGEHEPIEAEDDPGADEALDADDAGFGEPYAL